MRNCKPFIEENAVEIQREITNGIQGRIVDKIPRLILSLRGISERIPDQFPSESLIELLPYRPFLFDSANILSEISIFCRIIIDILTLLRHQ